MSSPGKFSRRRFTEMALGGLALPAVVLCSEPQQPVEIQRVCERMVAMDKWRTRTLMGYSVMRRYTLKLGINATGAEMLVKVEYTYPGYKSFQVISEKNSGLLEDQIFHRVMSVEMQAARDDLRDRTRITPLNYDFDVLGTENLEGRPSYVMRMKPKRKRRYLVDGKMWVDIRDAAVARIDGEILTSSFWVRSSHMVQSYERVGPYWLVTSNQNDASVRFLGEAHLHIEYFDYQLRSA
jgi:hypothetical protein